MFAYCITYLVCMLNFVANILMEHSMESVPIFIWQYASIQGNISDGVCYHRWFLWHTSFAFDTREDFL